MNNTMKTMMAVAACALVIGNATAAPDMAHYKIPTEGVIRTFVDGSMKNIPASEYEFPPGDRPGHVWTGHWTVTPEDQGQGEFKVVSGPWRIEISPPAGLHFVHPATIAKWLAGCLGRAFDSSNCETQFFVDVHDGGKTYEACLSPTPEGAPEGGGPSWDVMVTERIEPRYH
jgi:hypothetical protein